MGRGPRDGANPGRSQAPGPCRFDPRGLGVEQSLEEARDQADFVGAGVAGLDFADSHVKHTVGDRVARALQMVAGEAGVVDRARLAGETTQTLAGAHGEGAARSEGARAAGMRHANLLGLQWPRGAMGRRAAQPFQVTA
jgi:hypothetical protein